MDINESVDGAFITFETGNMGFRFVDQSQIALPHQRYTDIKLKSEYKYYGNSSWGNNVVPVTGTVESKKAHVKVNDTTTFCNVLKLSQPVIPGDSGSLVLSKDGNPIGLAFARLDDQTPGHKWGYAITIEKILDTLQVTLVNGTCTN